MIYIETIVSAFGGATAALLIVAFFGRSFIKIQMDKELARHAHALLIEKERLGHELAVELHQKNMRASRYEHDKIEALKSLYIVIVKLYGSINKLRIHVNLDKSKNFQSEYFGALSNIFNELSETFNEITEAYKAIEMNSIYIDDATEKQVHAMLVNIHLYYTQELAHCDKILL